MRTPLGSRRVLVESLGIKPQQPAGASATMFPPSPRDRR